MTYTKVDMQLTGAEIVIKSLTERGVDTIFGYPGGAVLPMYDALYQQNVLHHVLVRHEQGAVHMAEGYARSTGKIGAVLVTSGPGATNTVTGLADAMMDSIPLICITGQVPTHMIGNDAFQEADITGITRPCTKHNYLVKRVEDLEPILHEAITIALSGRPGPVLVDIPKDVFNATAEYQGLKNGDRKSFKPKPKLDMAAVEKAVTLIAKAKKPIFYTGGGVVNSGDKASTLLREFVRLTGFPCTSTLMGLGAFPASDALFVGMLGMHGTLEANLAMYECDVMINIGARFDDRVTGNVSGFSPKSKKIHVDIDPSAINKSVVVDVPVVGDVAEVLEAMLAVWKKKKCTVDGASLDTWWKRIEKWRAKRCLDFDNHGEGIKPQYFLQTLNGLLQKKDFYVSTDVGQHQMWTAQFIQFNEPNRWLTSGGLGTMGYGLPAAAGAQVAHPNKVVVCISGDGSIMMNIQELATIRQYGLPVKVIIMNNGYLGMVRQWQELFHGERYSQSYFDSVPDFVALAEACGIKGMRATTKNDVESVLKQALAHKGPVVVDMVVEAQENVYPMIPAGANHNDIELGPGKELELNEEGGMVLI